jgi:hypothetical protein
MQRLLGMATIVCVLAIGGYLYMKQAQSSTVAGADNPEGTVDIVGVKHDLMSIAQAQRIHNSLHGGYASSIDQLHSSGDLSMDHDNRGPYKYSLELTASGFRATATYTGSGGAAISRTISIDQTMTITEQ